MNTYRLVVTRGQLNLYKAMGKEVNGMRIGQKHEEEPQQGVLKTR